MNTPSVELCADIVAMTELDVSGQELLHKQIDVLMADLLTCAPYQPEFRQRTARIARLGYLPLSDSQRITRRLLQQLLHPVHGTALWGVVNEELLALKQVLAQLNPVLYPRLSRYKMLSGLMARNKYLDDYFDQYSRVQQQIKSAAERLYTNNDALLRNNLYMQHEKSHLAAVIRQLVQYCYLGNQLESKVSAYLADNTLPAEEHRAFEKEVLPVIRHKVSELYVQKTACMQIYLSLECFERTNTRMMTGIERTLVMTTTVLNTAILLSQMLAQQGRFDFRLASLNTLTKQLAKTTGQQLMLAGQAPQHLAFNHLRHEFDQVQAVIDDILSLRDETPISTGQTGGLLKRLRAGFSV